MALNLLFLDLRELDTFRPLAILIGRRCLRRHLDTYVSRMRGSGLLQGHD